MIKSRALFLNQCLLQFDEEANDLLNYFEMMPPETGSDEVFAAQFPAKLAPAPLHSTPHPPTSPHTPNKPVPQPLTSVPSPTRSILPALNPASDSFEHFVNYLFSECSQSSPKCPSPPGSPQTVQICPKLNMIFRSLKKEAPIKEPKTKKKVPRCKKQVINHQKLCYQVRHLRHAYS